MLCYVVSRVCGRCQGCDSRVVGLAWVYDTSVSMCSIERNEMIESCGIFYGDESARLGSRVTADKVKLD